MEQIKTFIILKHGSISDWYWEYYIRTDHSKCTPEEVEIANEYVEDTRYV